MYFFLCENKKEIVPIMTQGILFIVILLLFNLPMPGEITAIVVTVVALGVTLAVMVRFDSALYWFLGSVLYFILTIVIISLSWFPYADDEQWGVISWYLVTFALFFVQGLMWGIIKFIKWLIGYKSEPDIR